MTSSRAEPFTLAAFLADLIENCGKTQREIANACGYKNLNIITMFKHGHTKVPLEKVPELAQAVGVDPALLLRRAMREYMPEAFATIEGALGGTLSESEQELLALARDVTGDNVPRLSKQQKEWLTEILKLRA